MTRTILRGALAVWLYAAPALADGPPKEPPKQSESLDDLLDQATGGEPSTPGAASPDGGAGATTNAQPAPPANPPPPVVGPGPVTPPPAPEPPVRHPGPYGLGPLDCHVLDGFGRERALPKQFAAGEEPDLLCRIGVVQPPNVSSADHELTLTVYVSGRETYRQARPVRMTAAGQRVMLFIVPAERIASFDPADVVVRAVLSPPARPPAGQGVAFRVEPED